MGTDLIGIVLDDVDSISKILEGESATVMCLIGLSQKTSEGFHSHHEVKCWHPNNSFIDITVAGWSEPRGFGRDLAYVDWFKEVVRNNLPRRFGTQPAST